MHGTEEDVGLSASAEVTWHGASLACAEFARLGLIEHDHLPALISWMLKVWFLSDIANRFNVL